VIPVAARPAPPTFAAKVTNMAARYKARYGAPSIEQMRSTHYWTNIIPELRRAYKGICAYCAHWIPQPVGNSSVDHFVPLKVDPRLAYSWSNYRLACSILNGRKSAYQDVLDPFTLPPDWFYLDFFTLLIFPNPTLSVEDRDKVEKTIARLKLNDDSDLVELRNHTLGYYCIGEYSFRALKKNAPFIAYELERQDLVNTIQTLLYYDPEVLLGEE